MREERMALLRYCDQWTVYLIQTAHYHHLWTRRPFPVPMTKWERFCNVPQGNVARTRSTVPRCEPKLDPMPVTMGKSINKSSVISIHRSYFSLITCVTSLILGVKLFKLWKNFEHKHIVRKLTSTNIYFANIFWL